MRKVQHFKNKRCNTCHFEVGTQCRRELVVADWAKFEERPSADYPWVKHIGGGYFPACSHYIEAIFEKDNG